MNDTTRRAIQRHRVVMRDLALAILNRETILVEGLRAYFPHHHPTLLAGEHRVTVALSEYHNTKLACGEFVAGPDPAFATYPDLSNPGCCDGDTPDEPTG